MFAHFPRPALLAFLCTAIVYLGCVSFISYPLTTLFKPVPIMCLLIGVWQSPLSNAGKTILCLALLFSLVGDVVLTLPIKMQLEVGIVCFFLAHCAYIGLLVRDCNYTQSKLLYFVPALIYSALALYFILPHLGAFLIPVCIYFTALLLMVFFATQTAIAHTETTLGGYFFLISDTVLAYSLFVQPELNATLPVMFTYYLAQLFLAVGCVRIVLR